MDWKIFGSTFVAIFLAEMGDKTQLAAVCMTANCGKPVTVFLSSVLALALVTLIGVTLGAALAEYIPQEYIKRGAAALFVVIGVLMWFKVL